MADFTKFQDAVTALRAQVAATVGVEDSAVALIIGFADTVKKAVTDALTADNAADQGSIDAAVGAITDATTAFANSQNKLGAAVSTVTPQPLT